MTEKREAPTPRRIEKARKEGRVPSSRLFIASASSLTTLTAVLVGGKSVSESMRRFATSMWGAWEQPPVHAIHASWSLLVESLLWSSVGVVGAVVAGWVVTGGNFVVTPLKPRIERIDPLQGVRRIFSWSALGGLAKGLVLSGLLGWIVWRELPSLLAVWRTSIAQPPGSAVAGLLEVIWTGACWATAVAAVDVLLSRAHFLRGLRMSKEELRREHREAEGEPLHKAMRKRMHRQMAGAGPRRRVVAATVVVVNPTHIAVAIRYDEQECEAPYVVAKGVGVFAAAIRMQARALGIPLVRHVPLARGLVGCEPGEPIPEELYRAAAAVLSAATVARRGLPGGLE